MTRFQVATIRTRAVAAALLCLGLMTGCGTSGDPEVNRLYDEGRYDEAAQRATAEVASREAASGPESPSVALMLNDLGVIRRAQARYPEADAAFTRSLAIREKTLGPEHRAVAVTLTNIADLRALQGRYDEAEALYRRSMAINEQALAPDDPDVVFNFNNLGELASRRGQYAETEALYQRSQAILEKALGSDDPQVAIVLQNRAANYGEQGRYRDAEPLATRALAIEEAKLGPDHPEVANVIDNLAVVYQNLGRYGEAEQLAKRALAIREKAFGFEHPNIAVSLNNLAALYRLQARYAEAEPLLQRALAIRETASGPNHPDTAIALSNLSVLYEQQRRYAEAAALTERTVALRETVLGPDHPDIALSLNNLGALYGRQGRIAEAEALQARSLAISEKAFGANHPRVATTLNNLAVIYAAQGRDAEADALYRRTLTIRETLGTDHPAVAQVLDDQATFLRARGRSAEAVVASRRAVAILSRRVSEAPVQDSQGLLSEQRGSRSTFLLDVDLVHTEGGKDAVAETFRVGQLARASSAGRALAGMAARFAARDDALGVAVRDRQDLADRIERLDAKIVTAASQPPALRDAKAETALRTELAADLDRLQGLDMRIARDFPSYTELSQPKPLEIDAVRKDLRPDEAMLVYLVGPSESWLWAVRHDRAQLFKLPAATAGILTPQVSALRSRLDPDTNPDLLPVDVMLAHGIYQEIVAPAASLLEGARHVLVVPDGPLESLPMGVLVTRRPERPLKSLADHRTVAWFMRDHALTVLPSVGSLQALRHFTTQARASRPFVGVGDPVLDGDPGAARGVKRASLFRGGSADVDAVRKLPPLPETAGELRAVAKALGASEQDLYLESRASEPVVRAGELGQYRVIHFATHGLMSGDLKGLAEPALVLTPPHAASADNDGLLTASEVATLRLNADWVVLSACNTAAGDGTPDAGGLSGLAKAFFYAGARALLVSHWSVPSAATVELVTGAFGSMTADPAIGPAEALRRSQLRMMAPSSPPEFAHPLAWAPFVLAGEGGAAR